MQRVNVEPIRALEFAELPTRKYIVMWPLKLDEGRILKDFLLNQSNVTAKHVALAFVENAVTVERADCLYQIEAPVRIASETLLPAKQNLLNCFSRYDALLSSPPGGLI